MEGTLRGEKKKGSPVSWSLRERETRVGELGLAGYEAAGYLLACFVRDDGPGHWALQMGLKKDRKGTDWA